MKKLLLLLLIGSGCRGAKKPAYIWINNRCDDQWIQFEDGSFDIPKPGSAANAERLTVPCVVGPDVDGTVVWTKLPYRKN